MKLLRSLVPALVSLIILCASGPTFAVSLAYELASGDGESFLQDGWYLELGFGVGTYINPFVEDEHNGILDNLAATIACGYRYKNWFVEANDSDREGVALGYTVAQSAHWNFDINVTVLDKSQSDGKEHSYSNNEAKRNDWLMYRDRAYYGWGGRSTAYWDNIFIEARLLSGFDDRGVYGSFRTGVTWQHRNWNFHAIGGMEYYSRETANFLVGVKDNHATERFPSYEAESSWLPSIEFGVTYPLTEHWISRAVFSYLHLDSNVRQSPLIDEDNASALALLFIYNF